MPNPQAQTREARLGEVFAAFLKLGLSAFGGPIAHLGYFRDEFVLRRRWLGEVEYADLVALCQFLPGPASSQVGFALGLMRAGPLGALAAFLAFTLPSALLMVGFAFGAASLDGPVGQGIVGGLKIAAVAIVAQAVWGMAGALTPDRPRAGIALLALALVALIGGSVGQILAIAAGGLAGLWACRGLAQAGTNSSGFGVSRRIGGGALIAFIVLFVGLPLAAALWPVQALALVEAFFRSGALVFGGGHVVLPLLEAAVVGRGWADADIFLAGYGAAQALPGPLFTFAAYLGAVVNPEPNGPVGAALALGAIFLPGFLLLVGALPFWDALRTRPQARAAMAGTNAAVVGVLAAALYDPVFVSAVTAPAHFALAATGFVLLVLFKTPPWMVVALSALGGLALSLA